MHTHTHTNTNTHIHTTHPHTTNTHTHTTHNIGYLLFYLMVAIHLSLHYAISLLPALIVSHTIG